MNTVKPDQAWTPSEPAAIAEALAGAGLDVEAATMALLPREDRFAVRLAADRMAWFPANARGVRRLARERRVLRLIGRYCSFAAPRVIHTADAGWDVRALVEGTFEPFEVYGRVRADRGFAETVGRGLGEILVQLHAAIPAEAVTEASLPTRPAWPPAIDFARRRLPKVTSDRLLIERALGLLERYQAEEEKASDRMLAHTDLGFHNAVIDPVSGVVGGVFDFDGAACCDRHHDFRYLLLDDESEALLGSAASVYEAATGKAIDRDRVRLLNAACAVAFLAFRAGSEPGEAPAGRTLAEDLRWTSMALERANA